MKRTNFIALTLILTMAVSFCLTSAQEVMAGGWAVITVDSLPEQIVAGQPVTIGFVVRQHGHAPMADLTPEIIFTPTKRTNMLSITATPEGEIGHYAATVVLPEPGPWQWRIIAFSMSHPMPELVVQPTPRSTEPTVTWPRLVGVVALVGTAGSTFFWRRKRGWRAAVLTLALLGLSITGFALSANLTPETPQSRQTVISDQADSGRNLFVAKGCVTCHRHSQVEMMGISSLAIGPNLTDLSATPTYLRLWLKDPAAFKPETEMPTLNLSDDEIEALITFLSS